jgi:hypothetical protein
MRSFPPLNTLHTFEVVARPRLAPTVGATVGIRCPTLVWCVEGTCEYLPFVTLGTEKYDLILEMPMGNTVDA